MALIESAVALTASTNVTLHHAEEDAAALHVDITNRGSRAALLRLALAPAATPGTADWIEYDSIVSVGVPVRNWAIVVPVGYRLIARVDGDDCAGHVWGETVGSAYAGVASLNSNTVTEIAAAGADESRVFHVNLVNRSARPALARVGIADDTSPDAFEWIEYGALLRAGVPLRNWPILLNPGRKAVVWTDGAAVSAQAWGRRYGEVTS